VRNWLFGRTQSRSSLYGVCIVGILSSKGEFLTAILVGLIVVLLEICFEPKDNNDA